MSRKAIRKTKQATVRVELVGSDCATCGAITVNDGGYALLRLCRTLVEHGVDPSTRVEAYRGSTFCMTVSSIGEGALLRPAGDSVGFIVSRRLTDRVPASPVRQNQQ